MTSVNAATQTAEFRLHALSIRGGEGEVDARRKGFMYFLSTMGCGSVLLMADRSAGCLLLLTPLKKS